MGIYEYNEEEHIRMEREDAMDQGETLTLIKMIRKKIAKEKSLESIAAELEVTEDDIKHIYDLIMENPHRTEQELLRVIKE